MLQKLIDKQNAGTLNEFDEKILPGLKQSLANYAIENNWMADRLLSDVVTIMDKDLDHFETYRDSEEKALKDDPGFVNEEDNPCLFLKVDYEKHQFRSSIPMDAAQQLTIEVRSPLVSFSLGTA